jgi:uncharacterized membrane protein YesL
MRTMHQTAHTLFQNRELHHVVQNGKILMRGAHSVVDIYVFITITYSIPIMVHHEGIIHPVVSVSGLTRFIRYAYI